jgi:broad specificity phosphatase PhoE
MDETFAKDKTKILAYALRHGGTDMSPKPEGWLQIPLSALGEAQVRDSAEFIKRKQKDAQPTFAISSDLKRAIQTAEIAAKVLGIKIIKPLAGLRAFSEKDETQEQFEKRTKEAFHAVLDAAKSKNAIPLICCHRSTTAWMAREFSGVLQEVDYRRASLVWEGGVVILTPDAAMPNYRVLADNPVENLIPLDGTHVSGFVTTKDNRPPRECGNCKWLEEPDNHCDNPTVTSDDEIGLMYGYKRNKDGKWIVKPADCCNAFQNKLTKVVSS